MRDKIEIYYFSGTGNTRWTADKLTEKLQTLGANTRCVSIEDSTPEKIEIDAVSQIGLMFPIYSSFTPKPMTEFIDRLPNGKNTPLFVVQCAWLFGGHNAADTGLPLSKKGYRPYLFANVLMPNNLNLPPFGWVPIKNGKKIRGKLKKAEEKIEKLAQLIKDMKGVEEGTSKLSRYFDKMQRKADLSNLVNYYANNDCTSCGWCELNCPTGNIKMAYGKPTFGNSCAYCVRCYNLCPQEAIQARYNRITSEGYMRYKGPKIEI